MFLTMTVAYVYGQEIEPVRSPIDGLVLSYRTIPVARTGEWGYSVVLVVGEANRDTPMAVAMEGRR